MSLIDCSDWLTGFTASDMQSSRISEASLSPLEIHSSILLCHVMFPDKINHRNREKTELYNWLN